MHKCLTLSKTIADNSNLENTTFRELSATSPNAMRFKRENVFKNKSFNKIKKAAKLIIRNYTKVVYQTRDKVYFKKKGGGHLVCICVCVYDLQQHRVSI